MRSLSGAVYVAVIVSSLILNKSLFAGVCLLLTILGTLELYRFKPGYTSKFALNVFGSIIIFCLAHLYFTEIIQAKWLVLLLLVPLIHLSFELYNKHGNVFENLSFVFLAYFYLTIPILSLDYLNINSLSGSYSKIVLSVFILIWVNDTFAYLTGMLFGKHKLFERITPKKTWEGFAGGMLATIAGSWLLFSFSAYPSFTHWLILGVLIAIASVFGDFTESMFKRAANVKDSGNLMPGHGGILDRIDSLLFVFPVVFVYISVIN